MLIRDLIVLFAIIFNPSELCNNFYFLENLLSEKRHINVIHWDFQGRLPFRHDQQQKLEQYRSEWALHPAPGDKRRMSLRWKVSIG